MTSNNDEPKPPEESSLQSNAPAITDQKTSLDDFLEEVPPEILETVEKLLKQAGEDPSRLRYFEAKLKLSQSRHEFLPAEIIGEYEKELPGSGKWLLDRVEKRLEHIQTIETTRVTGWEKRADRAQLYSFLTAVAGIIGASVVAIELKGWMLPTIILAICVGGPIATQITRLVSKWVEGGDHKS